MKSITSPMDVLYLSGCLGDKARRARVTRAISYPTRFLSERAVPFVERAQEYPAEDGCLRSIRLYRSSLINEACADCFMRSVFRQSSVEVNQASFGL